MSDVSRGWRVARTCWGVLKADRSLLLIPVVSWLISTTVWILLSLPVALARDWERLGPLVPLLVFLLYFGTCSVVLLCNTALLHCVHAGLTGERCSVAEGFRRATARLDRILAWAAVGGLVGQVVAALEKRGKLGETLGQLLGGAWSVVTYFAVPVMILEDVGPLQAVRRSRDIVNRTWGQALGAYYGLGALASLLAFLVVVGIVAVGFLASYLESLLVLVAGCALILPAGLLGAILLSCLGQVFRTAVYHYARTSRVPPGFDAELMTSAFRLS